MTPHQFVEKWKKASDLSERSACQQHFLDLCDMLGEPKPADADPVGKWFTFEKGLTTTEDRKGFADVWRRDCFGWEYKGKHKDLKAAYQQLLKYREALLNPPLLVVCDLNRFEIHSNFPNTVKRVHAFDLGGLPDPKNVDALRWAFARPSHFDPKTTQEQVTEDIAGRFCKLADGMRGRQVEPDAAAHFLVKLMFCMFAEDIDLLPDRLFTATVRAARSDPARLSGLLADLFGKMAAGGYFGTHEVPHFNGGLFADAAVVELTKDEITELLECAGSDWSAVEPSTFGTLFERTLNPDKRGQLGAHYTSRADIETLLNPVLRDPLAREWEAVRNKADALWDRSKTLTAGGEAWKKARLAWEQGVNDFRHRLSDVTVLDPACGSGNFLYVALNVLLDLEKQTLTYLTGKDQRQRFPNVLPAQLRGIETNVYAQELAQVVIWIGYLQWNRFNGFVGPTDPILGTMENIRRADAILDLSDPDHPTEPDWPDAEFVVGNPPFLGGKMLRANLGDGYVDALFRVWGKRVEPRADLCCYWFEKARAMTERGRVRRAGLLATQGIRGGANRKTLDRVKQTGDIFFAVSDRDWVLDGASVHISMVGFDDGRETVRVLDDRPVATINPNLTAAADTTTARRLAENAGTGFMGDTKGGPFDIPFALARTLLDTPNVNGRPSSDVVTPWCNGLDVTRRTRDMWVIDYPIGTAEADASLYDTVYGVLKPLAEAARIASRSKVKAWWLHERPAGGHAGGAGPVGAVRRNPERDQAPAVRLDDGSDARGPPAHRLRPVRRLLVRRAALADP